MVKIDYTREEWYNANDAQNASNRVPISAFHLNRIETGIEQSVKAINDMNNYWWRIKRVSGSEFVVVSSAQVHRIHFGEALNSALDFYYSDSISFKIDYETGEGRIELYDPSKISISYQKLTGGAVSDSILKNKYFIIGATSGQTVYRMQNYGDGIIPYAASGYDCLLAGTEVLTYVLKYDAVRYVSSDKEDGYITGWNSSEGVYYEFLGVPFENSIETPTITTGYYLGDGKTARIIETPRKQKIVILNDSFYSVDYGEGDNLIDEGFYVGNKNDSGVRYYYIVFS